MSKQQPAPAAAAARGKKLSRLRPTLAIVLGSGFHHVLSRLKVEAEASYATLPGFPPVGVSGHAGQLLIGRLGGTPVMVLSGRSHFYEGHSMEGVTFAVRALAAYGIQDLLLTNAAGGVNQVFRPGDFMVLTDHINLMGTNPLRGAPVPGLPRFVDLTCTYDKGLRALLQRAGRRCGTRLRAGVYLAVSGPSYETPAEIRAFARLGADAVGMSTVPEAIVARQCALAAVVFFSAIVEATRSRAYFDALRIERSDERTAALDDYWFFKVDSCGRGICCWYELSCGVPPPTRLGDHMLGYRPAPDDSWNDPNNAETLRTSYRYLQAATYMNRMGAILIPHWLALGLSGCFAGVMAAFRVAPVLRRLRRRREGLCELCGYDRRASNGGCPECGCKPGQLKEVGPM